jgi:hypothetical protein
MSETRPNPALRLLPSLTDVMFLMPVVLLLTTMEGVGILLGDGDTGWHIRAGDWILQNGRVPDRDIFSFSKAGEPWFAWEWLWDAVFAWLHRAGGLPLVALASLLVISATFTLLFRFTRRKCGNVLIAAAVTLIAMMASIIHWLARPHLFTLLFVVVFSILLDRAQEGRTRLLWWLPPLTILWTNLHGGFFLGVILVFGYAAGELAHWLVGADAGRRREALDRSGRYWLAGLGCLAASLVNPYSYNLHVHIANYLTESYHFNHIVEFQAFDFHRPKAAFFEILLLLGVVSAFWSLLRLRFAHTILLVGFAHMALIASRNVAVYSLVAAPLVAAAMHEMLIKLAQSPAAAWVKRKVESFEAFAADFDSTDRQWRLHVTSLAGIALVAALVHAPSPPERFRAAYDPKRYPERALEMLRGPEFSASIFADDEWGDYLIYRLYPTTKVFIDGRSDFYGPKFGETYLDIANVKFGWEQKLNRHGIDTILLPVTSPMAGALKESSRWRPVYDDGVAIVFRAVVRPGGGRLPAETDGERISAASGGGKTRDRKITKTQDCDPRIAESNTRSESL